MKFSTIFSSLVAALAFTATALPVVDSSLAVSNVKNDPSIKASLPEKVVETEAYKALAAVHGNLENDKWYVLFDTTPRGVANKMDDDAERVRDKLGYDHVKLVMGQVKITRKETGPPKKRTGVEVTKTWHDVKFWELVTNEKRENKLNVRNWDPVHKKILSWKGVATKGSIKKATDAGKAFVEQYKTWGKCEQSHCGGFAEHVWSEVK